MDYGNLKEYQRERALQTKMHLDLMVDLGKLDGILLKGRVLDWGAGFGTNTQALNNFDGQVEAVETSDSAQFIRENGILPPERVYQEDGINFLKSHPDTYDLVASFLFGPIADERDRRLLRQFYEAAQVGIKPSGRVLLTSDIGSFSYITQLETEGLGDVIKVPEFPPAFVGRKYPNVSVDLTPSSWDEQIQFYLTAKEAYGIRKSPFARGFQVRTSD